MDKYKVKVFPEALRNIDDIYLYIALEKLSPENARRQTDRIWNGLRSLAFHPAKHQKRLSGKYAGGVYHQLLIDNYIAIFRIDENKRTVYVVTVQYQGRDI